MRIEDGYGIFDINLVGNSTNQTYMGTFKVKCLLSPIEQIKSDKLYRDLLGTNSHLASNHVAQLAYALSELHTRVVESPAFWSEGELGGSHLKDTEVILDVLENALEAQANFIEEKQKELADRQKILANLIRKKKVVPEENPDEEPIESFKKKQEREEEEGPEIDLGDDDE